MRSFLQHPDNTSNPNWWRGAVVYQIYPRSYQDSNGDGIGDLQGITERLPYVARLGVDAIWISPFFTSPMKDFGYDVSNYCDVEPIFGTLADFKNLIHHAHQLGLRVIIDQVLSHTSDQHPWFIESKSSADNDKADWYVWADAKQDGTPPNNWLSIFLGSAWQWDATREQYYFHNFLTEQPDLNLHHPDVQNALFDVLRFWMELGVDGFRLDTANFYMHDPQLRNNPASGRPNQNSSGISLNNPYSWQKHIYDKSRPENIGFLQSMRRVLNEYPGIMTVGEIGDDNALDVMAQYTSGGDKLHTAYSFFILGEERQSDKLHEIFTHFENKVRDGWGCWSLSNHDTKRVASRWQTTDAAMRAYLAMQMTLRGSPGLYQGDELGLPQAKLSFEQLRDPYDIRMWPNFQGRDGARTPMPWDNTQIQAGFSTSNTPWLPIVQEHLPLAVNTQEADKDSMLHHYRRWLQQRRAHPILWHGSIEFFAAHPQILAYKRSFDNKQLLCVLNLSADTVHNVIPEDAKISALADLPQHNDYMNDLSSSSDSPHFTTNLTLQPWQTLFAWLQ